MGGHNVNQDVIEYNFTKGIKRVRASLPLFENILFIDGTSDFGDIVAIPTLKVHIKSVWEKNEESLLVISYFPHFG